MLSLYKLKIFSTVVKKGSFSGAAKRLYLTQSAVSQHINALEVQLGVRLFERAQRGVSLTVQGETFLQYAHQILWLSEAAESAITDINHISDGILHLGATPSASIYLLPDWMHTFHQIYPSINVSLETDITSKLITQIENQSLELGILEGEIKPTSNLNIIPLKDTELFVIVYPDHPWSQLASVSIRSLNEEPFIARRAESQTRHWVDRLLAAYEITPRIVFELDDPESIKRAVIRKLGISILPVCAVQEELKEKKLVSIPLEETILKRQLKCVWSSERPLSAISRAFLTMLSKNFSNLVPFSSAPQPLQADLFQVDVIK